jgi:hypothetical protein
MSKLKYLTYLLGGTFEPWESEIIENASTGEIEFPTITTAPEPTRLWQPGDESEKAEKFHSI